MSWRWGWGGNQPHYAVLFIIDATSPALWEVSCTVAVNVFWSFLIKILFDIVIVQQLNTLSSEYFLVVQNETFKSRSLMSLVAGTAALPRLGPLAGRFRLRFDGSGHFLMITSIHVDLWLSTLDLPLWHHNFGLRTLRLLICSTQTYRLFLVGWCTKSMSSTRCHASNSLDSFRCFLIFCDVCWGAEA